MGDESLAGLGALDPCDAQGLVVEGAGAVVGQLLDATQLLVSDGFLGEGVGSAGLVEKCYELLFVQPGHGIRSFIYIVHPLCNTLQRKY